MVGRVGSNNNSIGYSSWNEGSIEVNFDNINEEYTSQASYSENDLIHTTHFYNKITWDKNEQNNVGVYSLKGDYQDIYPAISLYYPGDEVVLYLNEC